MAVFTAIASAIVGAITGAGFAATFAGFLAGTLSIGATIGVALTAAGLGLATAKATGLFKPPGFQQAKDPGVKVQLAPSTDNRVPVFYGKVHTGAVMVDAAIKNKNNTMQYVMVIGEKTDSGTYTLQSFKRGDATINFAATGNACTGQTDPNATATTAVAGKMRLNVYAGNAQSSVNQIFPTSPKVAAQSLVPTITANTNYEDLVYAVFEMDYDAENGLQQLGQLTFEITNSLNEPSNVLLDFLKNQRYGAGLSSSDLVTSSFNDMYDYANINGTYGNVEYTTSLGATAYHSRWQIDGMLSTYQPVKQNIDFICQASATFFTYDNKTGKFKVVPNRALTTAEKANCFVFNDDNITSKITIGSTELYSQYNSIEAEYPSVEHHDQTDIVIVATPPSDRNTNEPDNPLNTRFELVNDAPRVTNLANIDLRQSRLGTTLEFTADYSALQVDVGDVVKVTNTNFGYSDKLFRVMRVAEQETSEGMLNAKLVLLEYNDSVYTHNVVQSDGALGLPNIPNWWTNWGNANIDWANIIGNVNVVTSPTANANVVDPGNGNVIANVDYANIDLNLPDFTLGGFTPGLNFSLDYANMINANNIVGGADQVVVSVKNDDLPNNNPTTHIIEPTVDEGFGGMFNPESFIDINIPLPDLGIDFSANSVADKGFPVLSNAAPTSNANVSIQLKNQQVGTATPLYNIPSFKYAPDGGIRQADLRDMGVGLQVEDQPTSNLNVSNADILEATSPGSSALGDANTIIGTPDIIDLGGIEAGDYFFDSSISLGGELPSSGANGAYALNVLTQYQEKYTANLANVPGNLWGISNTLEGTQHSGSTDLASGADLQSSGTINIDPYNALALATASGANTTGKVYVPAYAQFTQFANSNLSNTTIARTGFNRTINGGRTAKGDKYINVR